MVKASGQLRSGILLNYLNLLLGNLIPIFYTPVMLQLLGQSEYGLYKISSSFTSYLSLISLGIGSAVSRYLILYRSKGDQTGEEKILGLFMWVFRAISVATLVIGTFMACNVDLFYQSSLTPAELGKMKLLIMILVVNMAVNFLMTPYTAVIGAHERFIPQQTMNIFLTIAGPVFNLAALWLGFASVGMAISSLALSVGANILYYVYVRHTLHIRAQYKELPLHMLREIFSFSIWVFVGNLVTQLYNTTDTVMIGMVPALAAAGAAVYSVGATFNNIVLSLTTAISNLLAPKASRMVFSGASSQELTQLATRVGRIQGYIFLLVVSGFIAFGRPFIHFYAGPEYADAYWVGIFMMIPNLIPLTQSVFLSIIVAMARHRFRSLVYLGIAVLNVVGTWFMMHWFGVAGAAAMTGIALLIGPGLVMNWYYWKRIHLSIPYFWKNLLPLFVVPAALCACTLFLSAVIDFYCIPALLAGILVYTLFYAALSWLFIMNDYEKSLIRDLAAGALRALGVKK